jgi:hypothetical protein
MAQASAILAGDNDPVTIWDRWSRFLEAGGQFVVVCSAGILVSTLAGKGRSDRETGVNQRDKANCLERRTRG